MMVKCKYAVFIRALRRNTAMVRTAFASFYTPIYYIYCYTITFKTTAIVFKKIVAKIQYIAVFMNNIFECIDEDLYINIYILQYNAFILTVFCNVYKFITINYK